MVSLCLLFCATLRVSAQQGDLAVDHSNFFGDGYQGPQTCEQCHPGKIEEMQGGVHYKFQSDLPEGYQRDEEGHEVTFEKSGKLWKLCGFPTTIPQFNWLGALKDLPETDHVDKPGGCAQCHVGIGMKPFTAVGQAEPQPNEANNLDCLVCHAQNYERRYYIATEGGEPLLNPLGSPVVLTVPKTDGVIDWSVYTEAAQTVGPTTTETCLRCHAAAGGGKFQADDHNYTSFKRGSVYGTGADVHADAGMVCSDCHYAGGHRFKRPLNNDLSAHDVVVDHEMCIDCHTDAPHEDEPIYNFHNEKIACTTCHATSQGGATFKDFSQTIAPDPDDPLGLYKVLVEFASLGAPIDYKWFNGTVGPEITPLGTREDGKIYPYKAIAFNQPLDANNHPVPIKWGPFFKTGNLQGALTTGLSLYSSMYKPEWTSVYGLPPVPGEFDHFGVLGCGGFSISHGITEDDALTCGNCHSEDSVLDFEALGYSPEEQIALTDDKVDHTFFISEYEGPAQCASCHQEKMDEVMQGVHYTFTSEIPEGYQFDEDGNPVEFTHSGKFWKLCGFPTTLPQFNWLGNLADLPETPHIDTPGGCGKCHIGTGKKPYTASGDLSGPKEVEQNNVDCLVCHASDYNRKFYMAKQDGEPTGEIMIAPKVDGVADWSIYTEAAQSVGETTADACLRCHAAAGGGTFEADNEHNYTSFKRGSIYGPGADVHADAGMTCSDCHYAGMHKFKRPVNNDLSAHDVVVEGQMCTECHTGEIHSQDLQRPILTVIDTMHTNNIACTTCHARTVGGATNKDFSIQIPPDPADPLGLWKVKVNFADAGFGVMHQWFNGTIGPHLTPKGSHGDGLIYPYKPITFNQPMDENDHPVPIKWGIFFKTGNFAKALEVGLSEYSNLWSQTLADTFGLSPAPGEFDHYGSTGCEGFSVSHGITKSQALGCGDCHSTDGVLDFEALGYSEADTQILTSLFDTSDQWFFAEGETRDGYETFLLVVNPDPARTATLNLMLYFEDRDPLLVSDVDVGPNSRYTFDIGNILPQNGIAPSAFGIKLRSTGNEPVPVYAERAMYWPVDSEFRGGGSDSTGSKQLDTEWVLAEGTTTSGRETYILVTNPNGDPTTLTVSYLVEGGSPVERDIVIGADRRLTIRASDDVPDMNFSTRILSQSSLVPIVVERTMYADDQVRKWGHTALGVTKQAGAWYVAEGAVHDTFETFVLLANTNPSPIQINLSFLLASGGPVDYIVDVPPNSRRTVNVELEVPGMTDQAGFSIIAQESQGRGFIAERAMYWKAGTYTQRSGATAVVGIPQPALDWFLPEGAVAGSSGFECFVLIGNPGDDPANIQVDFAMSDGTIVPVSDLTRVAGKQRVTVKANNYLPADQGTQSFSTIISSDRPIVVERAMYWSTNGITRIEGHANGGITQ